MFTLTCKTDNSFEGEFHGDANRVTVNSAGRACYHARSGCHLRDSAAVGPAVTYLLENFRN
jgi:hypothetical protein